jgi:hypothetical protein
MIAVKKNGDRWPSSALKRLASAVQLRPAAPSFQVFPDAHNQNLSQSVTKKLYRGAAEVCLNHSAYSPRLPDGGDLRKISTSWKPAPTPLPATITCSGRLVSRGSLLHAACLFLTRFAMTVRNTFWKIHALSRSVPEKVAPSWHLSEPLNESAQGNVDRSQALAPVSSAIWRGASSSSNA